ncbi:cytochrome P450 [Salinadaptatus halalkaliphilus]|uniref:Cytochrome P450 n=1 Tax=Salinadaptatus halalkaliphilus TaxID=2419781 RepID=A0A4S3TQV0_9EURY|nr:cytochrome P450 [Salinadaptatus halalkaliphilus]THE65703.1 cytochrome P450 [Salinadaptatus halalkaliphilus]
MTETHSPQSEEQSTTTDRSSADLPPGPRGLPLLGNTLSIGRDPLGFVESARAYGDVVSYEAYGDDAALLFDPHAVETVLVSRADEVRKGEFETDFGELVAPEGVAFTEGEQWRRQRQLLQSSFTPDRVYGYADEMVAEVIPLLEELDDGETVALRDAMATYTLRVLTRTLFDLPLEDEGAETVRRTVTAIQTYASPRRLAIGSLLPSWFPDRVEREYEASMAALEALVDDLVARRRETDASGDDLLSVLAGAQYPDGARPSPDEVRDQLVTFLFAGHETTAMALAVACWLVAGRPDVRAELDRELEAVCDDGDPGLDDLDDLVYTEAVVRETMRLYPPITGVYREPETEMVLSGYRVPAGTTLQLSVYGIQRDDRWWDEPETFRPERWLADGDSSSGERTLESAPDRPEYAYFPFGGGPRHCLGMRFAMLELQLALATIVRHVEFDRVTDSLEPSLGVTLDPGPLEVRVRQR